MIKGKGKSLCIFSAKGGVGKSTIATYLAGVFSSFNKKVLIIDFDLSSGAIATILNKPFNKTIYNFVDDYANKRFDRIEDYATKYNDNIYFLASPKDPRQSTKIDASYIDVILEKAIFSYDIVICDTNHILNEFNVNLLDKCDEELICMTNDLSDMKNVRSLIKIFSDAEKKNYKIMLNNFIHPYKKYYNLYDIKNMIKTNVDYVIDSNMFLKTYDSLIYDGKILTLDPKLNKLYPKTYKAFVSVYNQLMEDKHE